MAANVEIAFGKVPEALAKMSLPVALLAWLLFSVFWFAVAGPITLVIETMLFPFSLARTLWSDYRKRPWMIPLMFVATAFVALFYFWACRVMTAVIAFDAGIIEPIKKKNDCVAVAK